MQWEKADLMTRSKSALYIVTFGDLLANVTGARFLYAIIGKIFMREIIMTDDGVIESSSFIGANGILEAFGVIFKQDVFSGVLTADQIKITGRVEPGDDLLLRGNNPPSEIQAASRWISTEYEGFL